MPKGRLTDHSKPHPIRGILAVAFGIMCGHAFRIAMINRDGAEAVHETEFLLTAGTAIVAGVLLSWWVLKNKQPGRLTFALFSIAAGISAFVWH